MFSRITAFLASCFLVDLGPASFYKPSTRWRQKRDKPRSTEPYFEICIWKQSGRAEL